MARAPFPPNRVSVQLRLERAVEMVEDLSARVFRQTVRLRRSGQALPCSSASRSAAAINRLMCETERSSSLANAVIEMPQSR